MSAADPYIRLRDADKSWAVDGQLIQVLHSVHLDVRLGESMAIMGPSGSGKSTLLHVLGLLTSLDSGSLFYGDCDVSAVTRRQVEQFRRTVGFVFQDAKLIPHLRLWENVSVPLMHRGVSPLRQRALSEEALRNVGLGHRLKHLPTQLSSGEAVRAAIARALVFQPRLLLCDEPTGSLDSRTADSITEMLFGAVAPGRALIVVTHHPPLAEQADRLVRIKDGQIECEQDR